MSRRLPLQVLSKEAKARLRKICVATCTTRVVLKAANCSSVVFYNENDLISSRADVSPARLKKHQYTEIVYMSRCQFPELPYGPWEYIMGKGQIPWED